MWSTIDSEHYIFNFHKGSLAEKHIQNIISCQENCYDVICRVLNITLDKKINYYLCDTREEVGELCGDNEPCNGFCRYPGKEKDGIYALYNEDIKCLGYHEDTHYIAFMAMGKASRTFIREGLAMCFDKLWWGIPNEAWVKEFVKKGDYISIMNLMDDEEFIRSNGTFTYTLAGAFTNFLITNYGNEKYSKFYSTCNDYAEEKLEQVYGKTIETLEKEFLQDINNIEFSNVIRKYILDNI